jgi:hypothetical protein
MTNAQALESFLEQSLRIEAALGIIERQLNDIASLIRQKGSSAQASREPWRNEKDN